jgi:CBS domain-containing protein
MATDSMTICPSCHAANIPGADVCESCQGDLSSPAALTARDENALTLPLSSLRLSRPLTVPVGATVRDAITELAKNPAGAVVVMDNGSPVGIFTERDVMKRIAGHPGVLDDPITRHMTHDPVLLRETDTVAVALNKMGGGGFRHIPLMQDNELVAMVTVRDVITWMMSSYFD